MIARSSRGVCMQGLVAEREPRQKLILTFASIFMIAIFVVSALDYERGRSSVPTSVVLVGAALIVLGFAIMFQAFRDNSFAASIIQVYSGQRVIDTGLYAHVRHPMYSGALIMFVGIPLAMASWWGLVPVALLAGHDRVAPHRRGGFLARNLAGYDDYRRKVGARLVPGVW